MTAMIALVACFVIANLCLVYIEWRRNR